MRSIQLGFVVSVLILAVGCTGTAITSGGSSNTSSPNATTYTAPPSGGNQKATSMQSGSSTNKSSEVKAGSTQSIKVAE